MPTLPQKGISRICGTMHLIPSPPRRGQVGGMLTAGESVLTSSGRTTTPFPKLAFGTNRKATATVKRVDAWLRDNAIAEAEARGDTFNAPIFRHSNPVAMQVAEKDGMEEYLFGEQPPIVRSIFGPPRTEVAARAPQCRWRR